METRQDIINDAPDLSVHVLEYNTCFLIYSDERASVQKLRIYKGYFITLYLTFHFVLS